MFYDELEHIDRGTALDRGFAISARGPKSNGRFARNWKEERAFENPTYGQRSAIASFDKDGLVWWESSAQKREAPRF